MDSQDPKSSENGFIPKEGFERLVDYIKREHNRLRKSQDPVTKQKTKQIGKYQQQRDLNDSLEMKKGLQLKTAA